MNRRAIVLISGLIQGIGFRPFIYRLATKRNLKGYVLNLGDAGVRIDVNGDEEDIRLFIEDLKLKKPPFAVYDSIEVKWMEYSDAYKEFKIAESDLKGKGSRFSLIPPDISICEECIQDMLNPDDRHYMYPFTCCAICGPRFTTIKSFPYDRERTTMDEFPLCLYCDKEFNDPADRRFNAQTLCCPLCGPTMSLHDKYGALIEREDPIKSATSLLEEGAIVAIKGIGGIHIAVKTTEDDPVLKLRERRKKPNKPFAIMSPDIETIKTYALVSEGERELLSSYARPIVVLEKKEPFPLSQYIAPGLHNVGVMLPYSGIHYLLLHYSKEPAFVMTSANFPNEPMITSNEEALAKLRGIVDYFLLHNRKIYMRCDDSVVRMVDGGVAFLRRSRGYAPIPIELPFRSRHTIIATGVELMSTATLLKEGKCYLSQHIGDVENLETLEFLDQATDHMLRMMNIEKLDAVACDLHPRFISRKSASRLAEAYKAPLIEVQHHHAHLASLMAENGIDLDERVIGIVCDGVGYGIDGNPWGGEILLADYSGFTRVGSLEPQPMPGGDLCAYRYGRMLGGILYTAIPDEELKEFLSTYCLPGFERGVKEIDIMFRQLERQIVTPMTTSAGRFLDAASCLLGICYSRTYEGEGAMKLEAVATRGDANKVDLPISIRRIEDRFILETKPSMLKIYELREKYSREDLAASLQRALAEGLSTMALTFAEEHGVDKIGFTGGVAYNDAITRFIRLKVEEEGFTFLRHKKVPCGDGGISLGQMAIAASRLNRT